MPDVVEDLEPQEDASASSDADRFKDDKSINTAPDAEPEPAEVETKAEEVAEEPESEADPSPAEEEDLEEKTAPQPGDVEYTAAVKERIDQLTTSFRDEQRRNEELNLRIQELEEQLASAPAAVEPFKTVADFDYDEAKWQSYMATEVTRRAEEAAEKVAKGFHEKAESRSAEDAFRERENAFAQEHPDYHELVYGEVDGRRRWAASDLMAREIMVSDIGEQLSYYLANHPDIALQISRASPAETIRRMALLGQELKTARAKVKTEKKVVTEAPPPPPKIKSGDSGLSKDPADMSDKEFAAWRRKQIAAR